VVAGAVDDGEGAFQSLARVGQRSPQKESVGGTSSKVKPRQNGVPPPRNRIGKRTNYDGGGEENRTHETT